MKRLALILLLIAQSAMAETTCPGTSFQVFAAEHETEDLACAAIERCIERLSPCGLTISEPVTIHLSNGPIRDDPDCMGVLHCGQDRIEMLEPSVLSARLRASLGLTEAEDTALFDFILLHELVHAANSQMDKDGHISWLEDEYIAYAISIDALASPARDKLLAWRTFERPVRKMNLTEDGLWIDPTGFGILAWLHFSTPGNGCAFVASLLEGSSNVFDRSLFAHP